MNFNEYQKKACSAAVYNNAGDGKWEYPLIGLAGEVGELCNRLKLVAVGDQQMSAKIISQAIGELGDILWYLAVLAGELKIELDLIASTNLSKLKARGK